MSTGIQIIQIDPKERQEFFDFAKLVHPQEKGYKERLEWFAFRNPLQAADKSPGLVTIISEKEVIGQFLMSPFEFRIRQKIHRGYFGYDFFVKEEYRSRGGGALLFMQGVRMYKPFIGIGLTPVVEKISKAAGIQTIGLLKKFIWMKNPLGLGGQFLKQRLMKGFEDKNKSTVQHDFPDHVEVPGWKFLHTTSMPAGLDPVCPDEVIDPVRSGHFLQWRFAESPWKYHGYLSDDPRTPVFFVVRPAVYQGMRLLLIVDYRFPSYKWECLDVVLAAAKVIAQEARLDGVVISSTYDKVEEAVVRERFMAAGRPSAVIAYLPREEFFPPVGAACLTMADADLDFSFGEEP